MQKKFAEEHHRRLTLSRAFFTWFRETTNRRQKIRDQKWQLELDQITSQMVSHYEKEITGVKSFTFLQHISCN